jgi:hypothetical protein
MKLWRFDFSAFTKSIRGEDIPASLPIERTAFLQ